MGEVMHTKDTHTLYIYGNAYEVPAGFTIMTCMEHVGFRLTRGCGCRGAVCGACAVVYRVGHAPRWQVGLACQTLTQNHMHFLFLPYTSGQEAVYDISTTPCTVEAIEKIHPQLNHCIQCNTCTKSCPMGLKVLGYITALRQGNFTKLQALSQECIQCGLCAIRCPANVSPFAMALTARRLYAINHYAPTSVFCNSLTKAKQGHWQKEIAYYKTLSSQELQTLYLTFQASKEQHNAG